MTSVVKESDKITASQAAKLRKVSRMAINNDINDGKLRAERLGSFYIILRKDFDEYMKAYPVDRSKQH